MGVVGDTTHWADSIIESRNLFATLSLFSCDFFLGLSLALRSYDQIPASHWSTPPGFSLGFPGFFQGFARGFSMVLPGVFPGFSCDFSGVLPFFFLKVFLKEKERNK